METVLSYLQMDACLPGLPPLLASLPDIRATLHLSFHKTDPEVLAGSSPLAAQVLKIGKHRTGKYTASIPQLARDLGETFSAVQEELQALARAGEVSFTLSDQAVCYQVRAPTIRGLPWVTTPLTRGVLQVLHMPPDLSALAAALADRLAEAERCQVNKLDALFSIMDAASRAADRAEQERIIRGHVRAYFDADADAQAQPPPALVRPLRPLMPCLPHGRTDGAGAHTRPAAGQARLPVPGRRHPVPAAPGEEVPDHQPQRRPGAARPDQQPGDRGGVAAEPVVGQARSRGFPGGDAGVRGGDERPRVKISMERHAVHTKAQPATVTRPDMLTAEEHAACIAKISVVIVVDDYCTAHTIAITGQAGR